MSRQFKDGKPFTPKPKEPIRKRAEELVLEENLALLRLKLNLLKENAADDFLNIETKNIQVIKRAIDLVELHPFELLIKLAETELHLEATLFLYDETYKQKQFLEAKFLKSGETRLIHAANKSAGKIKTQTKYIHIKEAARQILNDMEKKDFKMLCRRMRAKFSKEEVSDNALRNYFKEITGLKSTK